MDDLVTRRNALTSRHPTWEPRTLSSYLDFIAAQCPDRPLVITENGTYTYAEIVAWSRRLARGLLACGISTGDNIAMLITNSAEFVALKYAISRVGAVAVPFNYLYKAEELGYVIGQSDSVMFITLESYKDVNFLAALDTLAPGWETSGGGKMMPKLQRVLTVAPARANVPDMQALEALGERVSDEDLTARERSVDPHSLSDIVYTSGTTGQPKGAMLTHDMVLRSGYGSAMTRAFGDGWRVLFSLPLYHVFGYIEGLIAASCVGGAVIPQQAFDPVETLRGIERHQANEVLMVPTMALAILDKVGEAPYDLSSLEAIFMAAAPAPIPVWEHLQTQLGLTYVYTGFGATEESAATTLTFPDDSLQLVSGTVGRPKFAGVAGVPEYGGALVEYKAIDPFTHANLPQGEQGELLVRGIIVTRGYYGKPDETAETIEPDGWLHTGDLGRVRADGYLELTGRSKDLYKCGSESVAPKEVEDVLNRHPAVQQAYVVGVPHRRLGEIGCAWVLLNEGQSVTARELVHLCRQHLARFKVPRYIRFATMSELPTTSTGKVQKFLLVERAIQEYQLSQQLPSVRTLQAQENPVAASR